MEEGAAFQAVVKLEIESTTITGNSTTGFGGGIDSSSAGTEITLVNSIVTGNFASDDFGLDANIRGSLSADSAGNLTAGDSMLAPLGNYGGTTLSMPPLPGSPAIDEAGATSLQTDQRGALRSINGAVDIGAVEFQDPTGISDIRFDYDSDGDGTPDALEFVLARNPFGSDSALPLEITSSGAGTPSELTFPFNPDSASSMILKITRSTDLINFSEMFSNETVPFSPSEDDNLLRLSDPQPPAEGNAFYRMEISPRVSKNR